MKDKVFLRLTLCPVNNFQYSTFNLCFFVSEMYDKFYKLGNLIKLEIAYIV